eukprot:TRINITY_DN4850_c0_g1_i1.p1 TRINITY_DN4850_c0_g1~~TRINITY_DN4850_c0_g1_i1.p1  ORF type:complete len:149 (+),score=28.26 TRINITY_DN4850_c0_g1_i1:108-554(+)
MFLEESRLMWSAAAALQLVVLLIAVLAWARTQRKSKDDISSSSEACRPLERSSSPAMYKLDKECGSPTAATDSTMTSADTTEGLASPTSQDCPWHLRDDDWIEPLARQFSDTRHFIGDAEEPETDMSCQHDVYEHEDDVWKKPQDVTA